MIVKATSWKTAARELAIQASLSVAITVGLVLPLKHVFGRLPIWAILIISLTATTASSLLMARRDRRKGAKS